MCKAKPAQQEESGWAVDFKPDTVSWSSRSSGDKAKVIFMIIFKICVILLSLYAFICSLSFLANGFRLVAGRQAGEIFKNSAIFNNPIAGMLVGVLVTVLVQSSSTSTSIIITMVAAELLTVKQAISLVMGANIGTSVTSTIVALAQASERDEFRRAFAAATVHDMFNFLTVVVILPLEAATGYLNTISGAIINASPGLAQGSKPPDILKAITKPFTSLVMKIDKKVITKIAVAETAEEVAELEDAHMLKHFFGWGPDDMSDGIAGVIILILALTVLCVALFLIVYTLKGLLKGHIAIWLHKSVNGNVPDITCGGVTIPMGWLSGYLAMVTGLLVTICVQSSSITTSALTPLVGVGVITVERMYPTVLGANIGTCVTGVLAALAADASKLYLTLQVAYAHLLFNITGIVIFYVFWPLRGLPVAAAKTLGNITATYRWFASAYLLFCFLLIPLVFFGLSLAGIVPLVIVLTIVLLTLAFVVIVNVLQARKPLWLPAKLRTWTWLPLWMRSLEPMDRLLCAPLGKALGICPCCKSKKAASTSTAVDASEMKIAADRLEQAAV